MPSLNRVTLIGNAGRDCELRYLANGQAQASWSIAVSRNVKSADGEYTQETDWFNVVAWRDTAERASTQITRGLLHYVEGRLSMRSWETEGVKHYRTEIVADRFFSLERKRAARDA